MTVLECACYICMLKSGVSNVLSNLVTICIVNTELDYTITFFYILVQVIIIRF